MKLPTEILDEIFRFTEKPSFVLYFKKLMSRQTIRTLYKGMSIASQAMEGNLQTIKYLYLINAEYTEDAIDWASAYGHLEVVRYLHETVGCKCSKLAIYLACYTGYLDVIKYLHEIVGAKCTAEAMDSASRNGHFEIVMYLHETIGATCTTDAMRQSSRYGFIEVVKYLHEIVGVDCAEDTMDYASRNGHLEVVKYLHETVGIKYTGFAKHLLTCKSI